MKTCANCRFWDRNNQSCHRLPPTASNSWPQTHAGGWYGEFQSGEQRSSGENPASSKEESED